MNMKRSYLLIIVVLSVFAVLAGQAFAGPINKPTPTSGACYLFENFQTDGLQLAITPGQQQVTARYRQCLEGANPGTGSADALMAGAIMNVPVGNTIPYIGATVQTQISLTGSIASGNFGGSSTSKASRCWLHLVFDDLAMTTGHALGACEWFDGSLTSYSTSDRINEPIFKVPCDQLPSLLGSCSLP